MYFKRISRASPEQVFLVVRNSYSATTMSVGHAAFFDYHYGTTSADGYNVRYPYSSTTGGYDNPAAMAGIVAGRDIQPSSYGSVQVYGHCDNIAVTGWSTTPMVAMTLTTDIDFQTRLLRPMNVLSANQITTYASVLGRLGAIVGYDTRLNVATDADSPLVRRLIPGGYVVPVEGVYLSGTTLLTNAALTATLTGTCKGFVHCL